MKPRFIFIILSIFISSCAPKHDSIFSYRGNAQGTTFSIKYISPENQTFEKEIDSLFRLMDKTASSWDSMSIISKINRNENPELNVHFIRLIETSLKISKQTDGYFDITVGSVVDVWGFGRKKGIAPDEKTIAGLMKFVGFQKIALKNNQLIKENENITIDLNAVAQGYTVDVIAEYFESRNIKNYLVEVGGEVRAGGTKENGEAWHVGIEKPAADKNAEQILQTVVKLNNKSLATSGNYRKYFEKDGRKYSHAIDPFTGFPVEHNLLSVSVIADNCTDADAFATAFLVMGKEKAKKMLEKLQHLQVLFIDADKNGNFQTEYINGFKQFESEKYKN